uniref:CN hydrolase domain-containing protein n=1 Tax=Panagrolaimus sp. PS1159 TaxID=55785 RepID=A0AC35FZL5_9BILA
MKTEWDERIILPSLAPRLSKCSTINVMYILELTIDAKITLKLPIIIGTIPLLSGILARVKASRTNSNGNARIMMSKQASIGETPEQNESVVQVTITDEAGNIIEENDELGEEMESLLSSKKRVTAMYNKGVQIYLAPTVDDRDVWLATMRTIALEGRCFVISACQFLTSAAFPRGHSAHSKEEKVLISGDSCAVNPFGEIILQPNYTSETIATIECDLSDIIVQGKGVRI